MKNPDWDDLRFFLALCEAGSLSGAARGTGVEHTTVARRIEALETALDARLFNRFPKAWSLTAAGTALLPYARKLEDDMHALLNVARGRSEVLGTVRVSAPPALAACLLAPRLRAPLARLPGVEIDLRAEARTADLMRRQADIALRFARPSAPGLAAKLLTQVDYALYAHADYAAGRQPAQWEFLGYDELQRDAPQQEWLDKLRGARRYSVRSNDLLTLLQAAVAGCGVAVLPRYAAAGAPGLAELAPPCPVRRKLWLVMHEDVRRSPSVRAVADEIIGMFEQE
ncbi:LysR family transcriptional regulator [Massilia sp. ST3]|uniref:LysR family transcriptional regulator n=1 Tax=Massilia sp. ST3 TaxID=2824903 RepID=UPI001B820D5B|nr:LysR family transcriptional regulator [Massilia sp. ST3]MBQ5947057.1 LysR family transcriptional regulator [Massilia sp. ST3]